MATARLVSLLVLAARAVGGDTRPGRPPVALKFHSAVGRATPEALGASYGRLRRDTHMAHRFDEAIAGRHAAIGLKFCHELRCYLRCYGANLSLS
jgi:hypothetical protein